MPITKAPSTTKTYVLARKIDKFWQYCVDNNYIPDVETLAMFLDVCRKTLWQWEHSENKNLGIIIKKAKNKIFHEQKQLAMRGKMNSAIFIFNAKNNFDYVEKVEHEHNSTTNINVVFNVPKISPSIPNKIIEGNIIEVTEAPVEEIQDTKVISITPAIIEETPAPAPAPAPVGVDRKELMRLARLQRKGNKVNK